MKAPELDEELRRAIMGDPRFCTDDMERIFPHKPMFNYYDQELVLVRVESLHPSRPSFKTWDGWFSTIRLGSQFDGGPLLNRERMCGIKHPQAQRWLKGLSPDAANDLVQLSLRHGQYVVWQILEALTPAKLFTLCDLNHVGDGDESMGKRTMVRLLMKELFPEEAGVTIVVELGSLLRIANGPLHEVVGASRDTEDGVPVLFLNPVRDEHPLATGASAQRLGAALADADRQADEEALA